MEVLHGNTCNTRRETDAKDVLSIANTEVCNAITKSSLNGLCRCTNQYYSLGQHRLHTMGGLKEDI